MTAAGDRIERTLADAWRATLGDSGASDGWRTLSPQRTYKPLEPTEPDIAPTELPPATLSGLSTQADTLSGARTLDEAAREQKHELASGIELVEEIGRGGMGIVFRARQASLAREIAVKLIRPEAASAAARSQFVAEALVNGVLDHPNIVPVHELGSTADGQMYLAMKLVGGTSWKALLHPADDAQRSAAREYDLERHLALLQAVGNAVAFAHSKGIVHRDLKPENVMVGAFGEVLVMDWGIAVDVRDVPRGEVRTRHKSSVTAPSGTPCYMPPELAEGRGRDIGPWTDTYLLGAILHELLTGVPPHRGETLLAVLVAAAESRAPRFPTGTPPGLAAICAKALERDPARRFRSVSEFQGALRGYFEHRESEKVSASAARALARALGDSARSQPQRYADFAEAIAGFRQALELWNENAAARAGEADARRAYARAALAAGDLGLAEEQVRELEGADELRGEITSERARVEARERAARRNRRLLAAATGLVVAVSVTAAVWIDRERAKAVEANAQAELARDQAEDEREQAELARQAAETQRTRAQSEAQRADLASREARAQLVTALQSQATRATDRRDDASAALLLGRALEVAESGGERDLVLRTSLQCALDALPQVELIFQLDGEPLLVSDDARTILVADRAHGMRLWDATAGKPRSEWMTFTDAEPVATTTVESPAHDTALLIGPTQSGEGRTVRALDTGRSRWLGPAREVPFAILVGVRADGSFVALDATSKLHLVSLAGSELVEPFGPDELGFESYTTAFAELSPDGTRVAVLMVGPNSTGYASSVVELETRTKICDGPATDLNNTLSMLSVNPLRLSWSPDGRELVHDSLDFRCSWDAATGAATEQSFDRAELRSFTDCAWVRPGLPLAVDSGQRLVFPLASALEPIDLERPEPSYANFFAARTLGTRTLLAVDDDTGSVQPIVIDTRWRRLPRLTCSGSVVDVAIGDGGDESSARLLVVTDDGIAKLARYSLEPRPALELRALGSVTGGPALSPDGAFVNYLSSDQSELLVAPIATPQRMHSIAEAGAIEAFSSDGAACVAEFVDGMQLFAPDGSAPLGPRVLGAFVSVERAGRRLFCVSGETGERGVADARSGAALDDVRALEMFGDIDHGWEFARNGAFAVYAMTSELLVQASDGRKLAPFGSTSAEFSALGFSPDDTRVAVADLTGVTRVLELEGARQAGAPLCDGDPLERRKRGYVNRVAFASDGRLLVSATDGHVVLWDTLNSQRVARFELPGSYAAWLSSSSSQLVVDVQSGENYEDYTRSVARLPRFEGSVGPAMQRVALITSRAWSGGSVGRVDWRALLEQAKALSEGAPAQSGFARPLELRNMLAPADDWRPRMVDTIGPG
ncbi:MAG: protein kinase [Planctomycetes bacterium]|nr:protein kinase [Planctomycetota bacterium]